MNDKIHVVRGHNIIECKICGCKMKEWESNNPQPLLPNFSDRVCRDCNDYVTASRLVLRGMEPSSIEVMGSIIVQIMGMASSLKRSREMYMKRMEEE